ncbi:hypothetical protein [Paenarthrobacter nitroguajacolicus]|uniref:hypothetical protein n=1 Tax=Paenarthrobacter nitroguajacolicus TaxID=211146 RepID=UPI000AA5A30D|nr:hypothetical protein [Paenarthrobacter nitroguajacolicus]
MVQLHLDLVEAMSQRWIIGDTKRSRARIKDLAATYGVDEVMVLPVAGAYAGTDSGSSPACEETLRLLAAAD